MEKKEVIIDNLRTVYWRSDSLSADNALVYLHGWGSEAEHFIGFLKNCRNFAAPDLPGFGQSDLPNKPMSIGDYADFLKKFLEKLQINNPILAGHSLGGSIIARYCATGGTAKKIILINSAGIRKKSLMIFIYILIAKLGKLFFSIPGLSLLKFEARKKFHKLIDAEDFSILTADILKETFKKIINEDLTDDLRRINSEAVIIWGGKDKITPLKNALLMNKLIKGSRLHIIKEAGHYSFIDKQEEFNKIFLNEIK